MRVRQASRLSAVVITTLSVAPTASALEPGATPQDWLDAGQAELEKHMALKQNRRRAKNVILFIGDGMGVSTVTAARILDGQRHGRPGEENELAFETLPYLALSKVYNTNQQTPDSAGTMTAMMTGVKTRAGVLNVDDTVDRGDCAGSRGRELETFLETADAAGLSTGIVTTARITHATPAGTYAQAADRNWEDLSAMPQRALDEGCKDIADQLINDPPGDGIEVMMGGGRRHFLPADAEYNSGDQVSPVEGDRSDGRDLTAEWLAANPDGRYVIDKAGFDAIEPDRTERVLGLFNESHMQYEVERSDDVLGEPSIASMTVKAIDILSKNRKGYFLMVEGGRIDHAHHAGSAHYALVDTIAFADAIRAAMDRVDLRDTLIIVTADHSHVFTIAGYPTRGNPILGKVVGNDGAGNPESGSENAADGMPYTTLGYINGPGFATGLGGDRRFGLPIDAGRKDLSDVDTRDAGYHHETLVPLRSETHSAEDVAIYAGGPWAHLFRGTHEQSYIYHVMSHATRIER